MIKMPLIPDKVGKIDNIILKTYLLTQHNPNKISMPTINFSEIIGVTIHNTDAIGVASNTTPCRAIYKSNSKWAYERC